MRIKICIALLLALAISCREKSNKPPSEVAKAKLSESLPFQQINLDDLAAFKDVSGNWKLRGATHAHRLKDRLLVSTEGSGALVNSPEEGMNDNLFTILEHGDIELELEVMLPKASNSGLYFQGRYEVQLFDSWGVKDPQHSDMGGIYQRWDDDRAEGKEGFEGSAPNINAAKAPGLWQHFRIIFHAPRFGVDGKKITNAWFEEVWLNGVLIHRNISVSGPTRAAAFEDEKPLGPLMIQGDHGPVAIKNIKYKLYGDKKISLSGLTMNEYENKEILLPSFDSLVPIRTLTTDSISANMVSGERSQRILKYTGTMNIPDSGNYLFDLKVNGAGGVLLIDEDTIVNLDGDYDLDAIGLGQIELQKGTIPFTLIYNKHRPWTKGFSLEVEGPYIQKHALQAANSMDLSRGKPAENIMVEVLGEPVVQRSFLMHDGKKRTHCISVGTPQKINYAYDLESGSLLKAWHGEFIDATQMWHQRGEKQLGTPVGFTISFHGHQDFAELENKRSIWPESFENVERKQLGYEFDEMGIPVFSYRLGKTTIFDKMLPSKTVRILHRSITINGNQEIWHKIAHGAAIEKLPDGTYIVNDESYFIDFSTSGKLKPVVRKSEGRDELMLKIPEGEQTIDYSIIW